MRGALGFAAVPGGVATCVACHGPSRPDSRRCYCCQTVMELLGAHQARDSRRWGPPVVPMALYKIGDPLHVALRRYKHAPAIEARRHFAGVLSGFVARFLRAHWTCLWRAAGGFDALAVVPSTLPSMSGASGGATAAAHLDAVLRRVPALKGLETFQLRRGPALVDHLRPSADAFIAPAAVAGRRVLVMDDTWSTGARARSAAGALVGAGAAIGAISVLGRAIDPGATPAVGAWWRAAVQRAGGEPVWSAPCCVASCSRGAGGSLVASADHGDQAERRRGPQRRDRLDRRDGRDGPVSTTAPWSSTTTSSARP